MRAVIAAVRIVPEKPARFVVAPGTPLPDVTAFRVEVLGSVREIDWTNAPLARAFPFEPKREETT